MKPHLTILWGICAWAVAGCLELDTSHSSNSGGAGGTDSMASSGSSTSSSSSSGLPSVCGNGTLEEGEQCDDGNPMNNDGCAENCTHELGSSLFIGTPGVPGNADGIGMAAQLPDNAPLAIFGNTIYIG